MVNEECMYKAYVNNDGESIILATRRYLEGLRNATTIVTDGTFDVAPRHQRQLLTLGYYNNDHVSSKCTLGNSKS